MFAIRGISMYNCSSTIMPIDVVRFVVPCQGKQRNVRYVDKEKKRTEEYVIFAMFHHWLNDTKASIQKQTDKQTKKPRKAFFRGARTSPCRCLIPPPDDHNLSARKRHQYMFTMTRSDVTA
jgi:hypothetical protein